MSSSPDPDSEPSSRLTRSLGLGSAVVVGVSAMVGTGVFAVWQPALQRAGAWLVLAVVIAGAVAALNATSTARLAARYPQAGGVYAYGRVKLGRPAGVLAGSVFIIGKTASASAAALTIGLYLWPERSTAVGIFAIAALLALNLRGVVRSTRIAGVMVTLVIITLIVFAGFAFVNIDKADASSASVLIVDADAQGLLAASALVFVAFAGYARITVLGEEVRNPIRVIPRAVAISFAIVLALYLLIAFVVLSAVRGGVVIGPAALTDIATSVVPEWLPITVTVAAVLAAGAVLLSLIAGVGRTVFAMADAGDAPGFFVAVGRTVKVPYRAEIAAALGAAVLVAFGGLTLALGISAAMILTYYAISHVAAMRLERGRGLGGLMLLTTPYLGLAGCVILVGALVW